MSVTYGFYNSIKGDRKYNALEMSSIFDGIIVDGVYMSIGDALNVKSSGGRCNRCFSWFVRDRWGSNH